MKKFKKLSGFFLSLLAVFGLATFASCGEEKTPEQEQPSGGQVENQDQQIVDSVKATLEVATTVNANFTLKTVLAGGVSVSWVSSNPSIISIDGQNATVTQPAFEDGDATVTLTATLTLNDVTATKTFTVTVLKGENAAEIEASTVAEALAAAIDAEVTVRGVVSALAYTSATPGGFYLTDATGSVYVFGSNTASEVKVGQEIVISAKRAEYKGVQQLSYPTITYQSTSTDNEISVEGAEVVSLTTISKDLQGGYCGAYIFENVYLDVYDGGSYKSYTIEDKDGNSINLYSGNNGAEFADLDQYKGKVLKVLFCINGQNSKGTSWRGHILKVISATDPVAETEPAHVSKTVAELATNKPTTGADVIYEVEGIWVMDAGGETYGNGKLKDASGNQLTIYGLCATSSVAKWEVNKYVYKNDKSYASLNLADNTNVKLGLIYNPSYDNYYAYFISGEVVERTDAEKVALDLAALNVATPATKDFALTVKGSMGSTISWASNNAAIAISGANATVTRPAVGEADVTVTLTATVTLNSVTETKEFTVVVKAQVQASSGEVSLVGSLDLNNVANRVSASAAQQVWSANGITLTNDKAASTTDVNPNYTTPARYYKGSKLTIEFTSGVSKVVFHCDDYSSAKQPYAEALAQSLAAGVEYEIDGYDLIVTFAEPVTSLVVAQLANQVRIDSIDIYA